MLLVTATGAPTVTRESWAWGTAAANSNWLPRIKDTTAVPVEETSPTVAGTAATTPSVGARTTVVPSWVCRRATSAWRLRTVAPALVTAARATRTDSWAVVAWVVRLSNSSALIAPWVCKDW